MLLTLFSLASTTAIGYLVAGLHSVPNGLWSNSVCRAALGSEASSHCESRPQYQFPWQRWRSSTRRYEVMFAKKTSRSTSHCRQEWITQWTPIPELAKSWLTCFVGDLSRRVVIYHGLRTQQYHFGVWVGANVAKDLYFLAWELLLTKMYAVPLFSSQQGWFGANSSWEQGFSRPHLYLHVLFHIWRTRS